MKPLKPGYDAKQEQNSLIQKVCDYFGRVYDDNEAGRMLGLRGCRDSDKRGELAKDRPSLNDTAKHFHINPQKVRRILVTGGLYKTSQAKEILTMFENGLTVNEIAEALDQSPNVIRSYLPYERGIYKLENRSVNADRLQRFKKKYGGYKKNG